MATLTLNSTIFTECDRIEQQSPARRNLTHTFPGVAGGTLYKDHPTFRDLRFRHRGYQTSGDDAQLAIEELQARSFASETGDLVESGSPFARTYPSCTLDDVEVIRHPYEDNAAIAAQRYRYEVLLTFKQILAPPPPTD